MIGLTRYFRRIKSLPESDYLGTYGWMNPMGSQQYDINVVHRVCAPEGKKGEKTPRGLT